MTRKGLLLLSFLFLLAGAAFIVQQAFAQANKFADTATPTPQISSIHPQFSLLDEQGKNVLDTLQPVSTMKTCGQCHDTAFIAGHSFHVDLGQSDFTPPGKWNPLTYRYLLPDENIPADLNTSNWVKANATRLVGGGPSEPVNLEMDCFLCHFPNPNIAARVTALQAGNFQWANTATLVGTSLVETAGSGYTWNRAAFSQDGKLLPESITMQDPTSENCAQCHGVVHTAKNPLTLTGCSLDSWQTATTGQVISPQKISNSGMNLSDKESLTRSFDIHAERGLKCTDCHYSLNNPAYYQARNSPAHLQFDPRRLDIGD
jgi:hypothetical protein